MLIPMRHQVDHHQPALGDGWQQVPLMVFAYKVVFASGASALIDTGLTARGAQDMGMGIDAQLVVPGSFQAKGLGSSDTPGCPKETWCVRNVGGGYRGSMNVTDALATSPNTAFAKLITQIGVARAVDMAIKPLCRSIKTRALDAAARNSSQRSVMKPQR